MRVVINQPTYIPWIGYFATLDSCDKYVIYDNVQFDHQSWQHRNKIRNQEGWMWLTVPIVRNKTQLINEVKIDGNKWQKKHWKSIQQNYSRTPYFEQYESVFQKIYQTEWEYLIDLDVALLKELAIQLRINMPEFIYASDIKTEGHKTDRLIPILKATGADIFIEGLAGKNYIEVNRLNEAGIEIKWFEYNHPVYPQRGEFIPYLSAIDLLFNTGDKAIDYIMS